MLLSMVCFVNSNSGSPSVYSFCDSIICKSYMKITYPDEAFFVSISNENGPMDNILWPQPVVKCSNISVSYSFYLLF